MGQEGGDFIRIFIECLHNRYSLMDADGMTAEWIGVLYFDCVGVRCAHRQPTHAKSVHGHPVGWR